MMNWDNAKAIIESNSDVREALAENQAEYEIIREIIKVRKDRNLTQKALAELVGTKQSNISRLESGTYNPSLSFLRKIAMALGKHLEIKLN